MKILSWNINSIKVRLVLIEKLIKMISPDVLCFQETKILDKDFPIQKFKSLGYLHAVFRGQKAYNGVAILSKMPIEDSFVLSIFNEDARHVSVKIHNVYITNIYVPAGGDIPDSKINPKFEHKMEFIYFLDKWYKDNLRFYPRHVLVGDFNVAPQENDVWSSKALKNVVSHSFIEREMIKKFYRSHGFIDVFRNDSNKDKKIFSWWSYRNKDWKKSNRGRRLDHIWITQDLKKYFVSSEIFSFFRDFESPSDHVPCVLELSK